MSEADNNRQNKKASIKKFVIWFVVILIIFLLLGIILPAISRLNKGVPFISHKLQKEIASMIRSLQDSDSLKIHNEFFDRDNPIDPIVKENIEINEREVIDKVANLLSSIEYVIRSTYPHSTHIGSQEFIEVYAYKDGTQTHMFRVIGNILEINENSMRRYECSDEDLMTKLREVVQAGGDWLGTRY